MAYLLDSDTLIAAKNDFYRFSFCPSYWEWILRENQNNLIYSVDAVKTELTVGNDDLATWVATKAAHIFVKPDAQVMAAALTVTSWAKSQSDHFTAGAISEFFNAGDYWLICQALAHGQTVVTREVSDPACRRRIKIPDACIGVGVTHKSLFQLLEDEGAQFIL